MKQYHFDGFHKKKYKPDKMSSSTIYYFQASPQKGWFNYHLLAFDSFLSLHQSNKKYIKSVGYNHPRWISMVGGHFLYPQESLNNQTKYLASYPKHQKQPSSLFMLALKTRKKRDTFRCHQWCWSPPRNERLRSLQIMTFRTFSFLQ